MLERPVELLRLARKFGRDRTELWGGNKGWVGAHTKTLGPTGRSQLCWDPGMLLNTRTYPLSQLLQDPTELLRPRATHIYVPRLACALWRQHWPF